MAVLGVRVDAWRGSVRLARDLPVVSWAWSEKWPAIPAGRFTAAFPMEWWPVLKTDPLYPAGQVLRVEIEHGGRTVPLPRVRVQEATPSGAVVEVVADTLDGEIAEDPWPYPSSPATGASFAHEARRLAEPIPIRLHHAVADVTLPTGLAWSGDRDAALLELVASRGARWQYDPDGSLVALPLGSVTEPDHVINGDAVTDAPRSLKRDRVSKATVVVKGEGQDAAPAQVIVRRLVDALYAAEEYGTIGAVASLDSGTSQAEAEAAADALLAEGGAERAISVLATPALRAGEVVRIEVAHPEQHEVVTGRVVSHTLAGDGTHELTVREGA